MLASLAELKSYSVNGRDGEIGRVDDLCLRDEEWIVRYVVVDMEGLGREALLLVAYLGDVDRNTHTVWADILRAQVANTPPLDRTEPLTRQDERELHDLYGWPVYWWEEQEEITPIAGLQEELLEEESLEEEGPQLYFVSDLAKIYGVSTDDGEVGILQDMIVDTETWAIPYIVIELRPAGAHVLLASDYVQTLDLAARQIHVSVPCDALVHSPAVASAEPITPELQQSLREYYHRYSR